MTLDFSDRQTSELNLHDEVNSFRLDKTWSDTDPSLRCDTPGGFRFLESPAGTKIKISYRLYDTNPKSLSQNPDDFRPMFTDTVNGHEDFFIVYDGVTKGQLFSSQGLDALSLRNSIQRRSATHTVVGGLQYR